MPIPIAEHPDRLGLRLAPEIKEKALRAAKASGMTLRLRPPGHRASREGDPEAPQAASPAAAEQQAGHDRLAGAGVVRQDEAQAALREHVTVVKELRVRMVADRILILCPAPLTIQWQDELFDKFDERFEPISADKVKGQLVAARTVARAGADPPRADELAR